MEWAHLMRTHVDEFLTMAAKIDVVLEDLQEAYAPAGPHAGQGDGAGVHPGAARGEGGRAAAEARWEAECTAEQPYGGQHHGPDARRRSPGALRRPALRWCALSWPGSRHRRTATRPRR